MTVEERSYTVFDAVASHDLEGILHEYIKHSGNTIASYLSLRKRWSPRPEPELKEEGKLDEYLQQLSDESKGGISHIARDETPYVKALKAVSYVLAGGNSARGAKHDPISSISEEADHIIWQSINVLSNSRPPASMVVYNRSGKAQQEGECQPLFDGSVANATPLPLGPPGSVRPSAGYGTLLHLACAMDSPFSLAIFLALGADARSPHTAFRRLMIHEAACCGSINCLTLLLELGKECALQLYKEEHLNLPSHHEEHNLPFFPDDEVFSERLTPRSRPRQPSPSFGLPKKPNVPETKNWLDRLKNFSDLAKQVRTGTISEMDAARTVLAYDTIPTITRQIIAKSCSFLVKDSSMAGNPFNCPWYADGHGNTPLHWAAFKNERECVSILLRYHADPNARAHPSGWTALHDAAYSNSWESVALLLDAGADVDIRANSGATPLCFAAQEDAHAAAQLLLERGADLSIRCAGGPRVSAAGDPIVLNHPNGRFSGYTPLHYCAHYNAHRAARVLLAHPSAHAAMEVMDLGERLPIHVAVARGSSDVLRELLHAGARIELPHSGGSLSSPRRGRRNPSPPESRAGSPPVARASAVVAVQEMPSTPTHSSLSDDGSASVSSPILRSMIPARPITSSKPWNCLTQTAIDECKHLILQAEQNWAPDRHLLFTPADRRAVMELLRVGKRLEQMGTGIFIDLWPLVLGFCGRGWFEIDDKDDDVEMSDASVVNDLEVPALCQDMSQEMQLQQEDESCFSLEE